MRDSKGRFVKGTTSERKGCHTSSESILKGRETRKKRILEHGLTNAEITARKRVGLLVKERHLAGNYTQAELNKGLKISRTITGRKQSSERKKIESLAHIGLKGEAAGWNKERRQIQSEKMKGNRYQQNRTAPCSEETKQKIGMANSANMKIKWQEDSYVAMQMKARNCSPNKPEQKLIAIIEAERLPFKYVGGGEFILGGKCPDFLNIDGKKQLIELFGTYWHGILDIGNRIEYFRQYGFSTLIIWEDEVKNEIRIIKKIKGFLRR